MGHEPLPPFTIGAREIYDLALETKQPVGVLGDVALEAIRHIGV